MRKIALALFYLMLLLTIFATETNYYIDVKLRTDDFYADTGHELGNPDPTWKYNCKIGDSDWLGDYTTHSHGDETYGNGGWYSQPLTERWSYSYLNTNPVITISLEGWEDDNGSTSSYDSGDDDHSSDTDYDLDITAHPLGQWSDFSNSYDGSDVVDCGSHSGNDKYKVEIDVFWQYSIPQGLEAELTIVDNNTLQLSKTNDNNYYVSSWNYQLSTDSDFSNIVRSGSSSTAIATIDNLDSEVYYYFRVSGTNASGTGSYNVSGSYPVPQGLIFELSNDDATSLTLTKLSDNNYNLTSWEYQLSTDSSFSEIVSQEIVTDNVSILVNDLEVGNEYYARVRGLNQTGTGMYGDYSQIVKTWAGQGTEDNPYLIKNFNDLVQLSQHESYFHMYFLQTTDIDATESINMNDGLGFKPIGFFNNTFQGVYDGNNNVISNLYINRPDESRVGLFGFTYGYHKNININNSSITGNWSVGILVGRTQYGVTIENCHVSGQVIGEGSVGGLVGWLYYESTVKDCSASGSVYGEERIGGLVGYVYYNASVATSYSNSTVEGTDYVGGLIGKVYYQSQISNCYSKGALTAQSYGGGLVGFSLSDCLISSSFSTVQVNHNQWGDSFGLLLSDSDCIACFTDVELAGEESDEDVSNLTTNQMHNPNYFLEAGWDFLGESENGTDDVWIYVPGDYPYLAWQEVEINPITEVANPHNVTLNEGQDITISWDEVTNATSYILEISTDLSSWTTLIETYETSHVIENIEDNKLFFRVKGKYVNPFD